MGGKRFRLVTFELTARWAATPLFLLLGCGGSPSRGDAATTAVASSHTTTRAAVPATPAISCADDVVNDVSSQTLSEPLASDGPPHASPTDSSRAGTQAPLLFAPALLRKGPSCWASDAAPPGPPVFVVFGGESLSVSRGRCLNSGAYVLSSAERPFFVDSFFSVASSCLFEEEEAKYYPRFEAFLEVVKQTFDISMQNGRPRLLGEKGQTLAQLRSPTKTEKAEHCPNWPTPTDTESNRSR